MQMTKSSIVYGILNDQIAKFFGDCYADENGVPANMACCACGGGTGSSKTPSPTRFPSTTSSDMPTSIPSTTSAPSFECADTPLGWYDADGEEYNCTWYAEGSNCEVWGDCCADENGVTANMVCCTCG